MKKLIAGAATAAAIATPPCAQSPEPGYQSSLDFLPNAVQAVYDLPGPGVVYYDGLDLVLDDGHGLPQPILSFDAPPLFASFTIPIDRDAVLFGESERGEVWYVPLDAASAPRHLATIPFNFDALQFDARTVLVSAKTGGFSVPDNDILALDLVTGATDRIASVPGFSGPIALDVDGDLLYATSTLSTSDLLEWSAAQVASAFGPGELTAAHATTVFLNLPSAIDLAVDDDGDVFASDFTIPALLEVSRHAGETPALTPLITYQPGNSVYSVAYVGAPDAGAFEPFQPAFGKRLSVVESVGSPRVRTIRPARPQTTVPAGPVPGGAFSITTSGAPANALGARLIGLQFGPTLPLPLHGIEQPVLLELDFGALIAVVDAPFDANGVSSLQLFNNGFAPQVDFVVQHVFVGTRLGGATVVGSAGAETLSLSM